MKANYTLQNLIEGVVKIAQLRLPEKHKTIAQ